MAERYQTKAPVRFTRDGTVTLQQDQGSIYEEMSSKKDLQQTEENMYTDLQFGETQPTNSSSSSSSNGGAQVGVVRGKTNTKIIVAVAIAFTACVILVAFALIIAGVALSSSQETSKDSTRANALIQSLEGQLTRLREEFQASLRREVTQLRQELNSTHSTLAVAQHSFNTSLHTPLHPYQNCYTDTTEERIPPTGTYYYTRRAATDFLNINATGYYTLDIRCHYQSSYAGYAVVTQLFKPSTSPRMRCFCHVFDPQGTSGALRTLPTTTNYYLTCILSITRCPLTQTIV